MMNIVGMHRAFKLIYPGYDWLAVLGVRVDEMNNSNAAVNTATLASF